MTFRSILLAGADSRPRLSLSFVIFALFFAFSLWLVAACPIPAMSDYLNHLARMHLLVDGRNGEVSPFYLVSWSFCPNMALDLTVPTLARWMSVETAARLMIALAQILIVTGAVALEWVVKKRFEFAGFIGLLLLYALPFAWGFSNFEIGMGLSLWGVAAWLALRQSPFVARLAVHVVFVVLLFCCHLVALGVYGFTLGVLELFLFRARAGRAGWMTLLGTMAFLAAPALALAAIMAAQGATVGADLEIWDWAHKPVWPVAALNGYNLLFSGVGVGVLSWLLLRAWQAGALRPQAGASWLAPAFVLLYLATPQMLRSTAYADVRIVVAATLILPAFISIDFADPRWRRGSSFALAGLIAANFALTAWLWLSYQADYAAMIASFSQLDRGAKILVARRGDDPPFNFDQTAMRHGPSLAVHYAGAFVSTFMAMPGKQPVNVRAPYERIYAHDDGATGMDELVYAAQNGAGAELDHEYVRNWPRDYDYIYYVDPPRENPLPQLLKELTRHPRFTLYRIRKPAP